jgi:hypothetical protein
MAVEKSEVRTPRCRHIRSQESFFSNSPHLEDEFHSGVYWCNLTAGPKGPDGACADREECSSARACFNS